MSKIIIVIPTYNRPNSLKRLLCSIAQAKYPHNTVIDLTISCDYSGTNECINIADEFNWTFGQKKIIKHTYKLGLHKHILFCGDFVEGYDGIIMLEDDLWVSPFFYNYVLQANSYYKDNSRIAQISLYSYQYDDYSASRFIPIQDDFDNYFIQVPSSWGQFWTKEQWFKFRNQYNNGKLNINATTLLPDQVIYRWPESSWKKYFYNYIIRNDLFVVYPRHSLSTNFGEPGTHYGSKVSHTQSPIENHKKTYRFSCIAKAYSIYDYNFELHPLAIQKLLDNRCKTNDIEFDLNGTKSLNKIFAEHLVSSKTCKNPIFIFGAELLPQELNIKHCIKGNFYSLGKTSDFVSDDVSEKIANRNIGYIPLTVRYKIENKIKNKYENSTSFKIIKPIISFFSFFKNKK
ncbi:MAG: glycosyltransferase [Candidatus Woesearchaeota archaeon]